MAKARKKRPTRVTANDAIDVDQLVTPEAQRHGDYAVVEFVEKAGRRPVKVMRNRGGTAVERWMQRGDLTRAQQEAIGLYARCWRTWIGEQRVTANWGLVASLRGGEADMESFVASTLQAKKILDHLDDAVFFALPLPYFEVWKNVVVFDEAAGVAGARLGYANARAEAAAKAIVLMIADIIATDMRLGDQR